MFVLVSFFLFAVAFDFVVAVARVVVINVALLFFISSTLSSSSS
jgi:hypothetical protein